MTTDPEFAQEGDPAVTAAIDVSDLIGEDFPGPQTCAVLGIDPEPVVTETFIPTKRDDFTQELHEVKTSDSKRMRQILKKLPKASDEEVHELYLEIYGADFSGRVTVTRAKESIAEAIEECFTSSRESRRKQQLVEEETMESNEQKPADVADLVGETAPASPPVDAPAAPAQAEAKKEEAVKKPAKKSTKPAVKKEAKPKVRKDPTILLRDPEIKRDKDGKIVYIIGTCTWKEGGKFACDKKRKIHAADAFQVRYCDDHKVMARSAARAKAAKKK